MAPVGQPFSLPPLPDSSPKPQIHDAGLLSSQVPPRLTHSGCIPVSSRPPFPFLDQAPTFCSIFRDILGVGKMRWRGGRKMYKVWRLPSKRSHFHMGDAQLKIGYNSILKCKERCESKVERKHRQRSS